MLLRPDRKTRGMGRDGKGTRYLTMQVSTRAILPVLVRWFNPSILAAFSWVNERGTIGRGERLAGVPSCMTTQKGAGGVVGKSAAARR